MDIKKYGILITVVLLITAAAMLPVFAGEIVAGEEGDFRLETTNVEGADHHILLEWDEVGADVFYTIYQSDDEMVNWGPQSGNYGKAITVLNVYPNRVDSGYLAEWMQEHGQGLISVDKVPISSFNVNPDTYLEDASGDYKYDVIAFGFWDSNNSQTLSAAGRDATEAFIENGRGVLFGHDTLGASADNNFGYLARKYLNMDLEPASVVPFVASERIQSVNDGYLLRYPWNIEYGVEFEVPLSHTSGQIAYGTIWMNYARPFNDFHANSGEETIRGTGTSNFYLTTWNNTAQIQTGHTSGSSTPTEQRILANVLTYLAQYTDDTWAKDQSAIDYAAPKVPEAEWGTNVNQVTISAEDQGTPYWYKIEATSKHDITDIQVSDVVKEYCTNGIYGYYVIEDSSDYIDFDEREAAFYQADANGKLVWTMSDIRNYLHVKAVDYSGNLDAEVYDGNVSEAARFSPRDLGWSFELTKQVDQITNQDEEFVFQVDYRLTAGGTVLDTFYGVVTVPAGDPLAAITFENLYPGIYTITERDNNWNYLLDGGDTSEKTVILTNSSQRGIAVSFKNNEVITAFINGKHAVENKMKTGF